MSNGTPTPHGTGDTSKAMFREVILNDILAIKVEAGKPLRQVQVPGETYKSAKRFILNAPNTSDDDRIVRFKILYALPSGKSIYDILAADACGTSLDKADAKIAEWRDAIKALLRYALNLLLAPKRPEFQRLKLSSSYYVYQVSKKLKGAEEILQGMGYERVGGSDDVQELKYNGEVSSGRVAETAADLVILDGELERIKGLVLHARNEKIPIVLSHILQARSHPTQLFNQAKHALYDYAQHGTLPVVQHHTIAPSHPPNTQPSRGQNQQYPPTQGGPPPPKFNGQQHSGASNTQHCWGQNQQYLSTQGGTPPPNGQQHSGANTQPSGGQNQHYPPAQGGHPPLQHSGANTQPPGGQNQHHPPAQGGLPLPYHGQQRHSVPNIQPSRGGPVVPYNQQHAGIPNAQQSGGQMQQAFQHNLEAGILPNQHNLHTRSSHTSSAQGAVPHGPENLQYAGQSRAAYGGYSDSNYHPHQQEQVFASQGGQPARPFEHNSPTPQQSTSPTAALGRHHAPRGDQPNDHNISPAEIQLPPRDILRNPAQGHHHSDLPSAQYHHKHHENQTPAPTHPAREQEWVHSSAQGQQPHNTDPAQHHHLAVNTPTHPQQSRGPGSMGMAEQRIQASEYRRHSTPAVSQHLPRSTGGSGQHLPGSTGGSGQYLPGSTGGSGQHLPGSTGRSGQHLPGSTGGSGQHLPGSTGGSGQHLPGSTGGSGQGRGNEALYANLPLLMEGVQEQNIKQFEEALYANINRSHQQEGVMEQNNQQPEQVGYVNVNRPHEKEGDYAVVTIRKDPRQPATPPDPLNLPDPFVQSLSELDRMKLMSPNSDYGPASIVNARSDEAGYGGFSMDSLYSIRSPEDRSLFNKQADNAWQVGTPPQEQPGASNQRDNSASNTNRELPAPQELSKRFENELRGHSVPPAGDRGTAANANVDGNENVTDKWLDKYESPEYPDFLNQQPKDLNKDYNKPIPDSKQKLVRQLSSQSRDLGNQTALAGGETGLESHRQLNQLSHPPPQTDHHPPPHSEHHPPPHRPQPSEPRNQIAMVRQEDQPVSVSQESTLTKTGGATSRDKQQENTTSTTVGSLGGGPPDTQDTYQNTGKLAAISNRFDTGKSKTSPIVSRKSVLPEPERRHTSPLNSLNSGDYDHLLDREQLLSEMEKDRSVDSPESSFVKVTMVQNVPTDTGTYSLATEEQETLQSVNNNQSLSNSTLSSLAPVQRRRSDALSTKTRQKSVDTALSDHMTSEATGESGRHKNLSAYQTSEFSDHMTSGAINENVRQGHEIDPVTKTHLSEMRGRANTHTDLDTDQSKRDEFRGTSPSNPLPAESTSQALVENTWTCGYCYNLVFDEKRITCDVCGHYCPGITDI